MARGVTPRRPARSGRHEGTRQVTRGQASRSAKTLRGQKRGAKAAGKVAGAKKAAAKVGKVKGYNPLAPERVQGILEHLDTLYPQVRCALHHNNAWELLVATILSAQSTDANVNRVTPRLFAK
ncbi:MAG TPA: hypothetical protein VGY66_28280, partial [Gemmataceae bacterium]|nr:hypothetical protein [Gemmataceae bacterium]